MKNWYDDIKRKKWYAYTMITTAAILFTVAVQIFVQVAKTFTSGVSAIALVPTLLSEDLRPYLGLMYLGLNIPLLIIFWNKIKKDFLYKTTYYLVVQAAFGALFLVDDMADPLRTLIIPDESWVFGKIWPIFLLAGLGGAVVGVAIAITWKFGGSSAGGDIITYYYSTKKKISVGLMSFIISMGFVFLSFVTTIILKEDLRKHALPILLATIMYVGISGLIISRVYPKYSKIMVEVHSTKIEEISKKLKERNFNHSWQVRDVNSGFTGEKKKILTSVILLLEFKEFKKDILSIDPQAWISATIVRALVGNFDTSKID